MIDINLNPELRAARVEIALIGKIYPKLARTVVVLIVTTEKNSGPNRLIKDCLVRRRQLRISSIGTEMLDTRRIR